MARNDHEQAKASGELQRRHETLPAERGHLIREKIELERQLEAEQEYIVNKLQKQTAGLAREGCASRRPRRAPQAGGATPLGQDPTPSGKRNPRTPWRRRRSTSSAACSARCSNSTSAT